MVLRDRRVLILGGTSGIGLAVAQAVAAEAAQVVIVSSQPAKVDAAIALLGQNCAGFVADLSSEQAIAALFEKLGRSITWYSPPETQFGSARLQTSTWTMRNAFSM